MVGDPVPDVQSQKPPIGHIYLDLLLNPPFRLDAAQIAHQQMEEIMANINDTVTIDKIIRPLYNFKAADA